MGEKCQDFKQLAFHTALYKCPILFHKLFFPVAPELDNLTNIFYTMMPSSFYSVLMGYWPSTYRVLTGFYERVGANSNVR